MNPVDDFQTAPKGEHESNGGCTDGRKVTLVGVSSGVAAGRKLHVKGNAQIEWWTLFTTLDQFDQCLTSGQLRFGDPILFAQVRMEFEHVFNRSIPCAADSGARAGCGLRSASP